MRNFFPVCFVIFLLAGIYSCNNSDVVNTGSIATMNDDSILVTDDYGRVIGGDHSDWCIGDSVYLRGFGPAYPNPTNNEVKIQFVVNSADTVSLYFLTDGDTTFLMNKRSLASGLYTVSTSASALGFANSYRRLYIQNKRGSYISSPHCNNFGDIHFR
ncbi:MAG: hypothetical protein J0M18_06365 [Ignavibacteria bacterium]|nr:hypothetical protein [Ignavibacteria bacterium]